VALEYVGRVGTGENDVIIRSDLNGYAEQSALSAWSYGISSTNTPLQNRNILSSLVAQAVAAGLDVRLPPFEFSIQGTIDVPSPGKIVIYGDGTDHSKIKQTLLPYAIFNVTGQNVTIRDVAFIGQTNGAVDMTGGGTAEDYAAYCGVWMNANSHGGRVLNVSGQGLHRAVRVDPGIGVTPAQVPNLRDIVVDGVDVDRCWVGVTGVGMTDCVIRNVRGTYIKATSTDGTNVGQPPHLIYTIDRSSAIDSDSRWSFNVEITDCMAWESTYGKAYAIKGIIGGSTSRLHARACHGLLDMISLEDYSVTNCHSTSDIYPASGNESSYGSVSPVDCTRLFMDDITVRFADMDHGPGWYNLGTTDITIKNLNVTAQRLTEDSGDGAYAAVVIKGTRTTLIDPVVNSIHANINAGISCVVTGLDAIIKNPKTSGNMKYGVLLYTMTGVTVEYDPARLGYNPAMGSAAKPLAVRGNATGAIIRPMDRASLNDNPGTILWEMGLDLPMGAHGPSVTTSGHIASIVVGVWTTDLANTYGRSYESGGNGGGVLGYALNQADVRVETVTKYGTTNALSMIGPALRVVDTANLLGVGLSSTGLKLIKRVAGVETTLLTVASTVPVVGKIYRVDAEIFGNVIDLYLNGSKAGTYTLLSTDITLFAGVKNHGFFSNRGANSRFNSLVVRDLS